MNNPLSRTLLIILTISMILGVMNSIYNFQCHIAPFFDNDKYCRLEYTTNFSNDPGYYKLRSYMEDKKNEEIRIANELENKRKQEVITACYNNGSTINISIKIFDYNLSCNQIDYLNSNKVDKITLFQSGSISGHYRGIFSHGEISGATQDYIVEKILAKQDFVKSIYYHLDCNSIKSEEKIEYYTPSDFVIYYMENCLR